MDGIMLGNYYFSGSDLIFILLFMGIVSAALEIFNRRYRAFVDMLLFGGPIWAQAIKCIALFQVNYPLSQLQGPIQQQANSHIEPTYGQFLTLIFIPIVVVIIVKMFANYSLIFRKPWTAIFCVQIIFTLCYWINIYLSIHCHACSTGG